MPTIKLTQAAVDKLKPPASGRLEYWDKQLAGFGLRVSAPGRGREGRKTWQVMYRVNGKLVRETIGTLATFPNVADARERARESLQKVSRGINPVAERKRQKIRDEAEITLSAAIARYLKEYAKPRMRPDYFAETERALRVDAKPLLDQLLRDIARRDIRALLGDIVARGRAPHASHVLSYLRPMLGWCVEQELIDVNPAAGIPDPDPRRREQRERDRYLDDDEIRLLWSACDVIGWPFGPLFQLLLLLGCRRDELARATWDEFDFEKRQWTLPRGRSKNDKEHLTHLSAKAIEILQSLQTHGNGGLVFTTTGSTPSRASAAHMRASWLLWRRKLDARSSISLSTISAGLLRAARPASACPRASSTAS